MRAQRPATRAHDRLQCLLLFLFVYFFLCYGPRSSSMMASVIELFMAMDAFRWRHSANAVLSAGRRLLGKSPLGGELAAAYGKEGRRGTSSRVRRFTKHDFQLGVDGGAQ
ncbi:hypothetical protein TraAM80_09936 [Trypanosoma rangeli]|uniref:Uncharacterized protein n=1 Tax=Trypanosoma rangeli TaxID=5698 RepID=A0A3R7JVP1_TRYRA|nr:uncharacterized protein TraAM80_09936 [Trypanosoma rangeli]RNE96160.1 hypothetical protein TraAM80_09936 [Trypanosoma rangeli]|eukprot:RNE96160.1 hypothetical protein TraAM80_09936 [Trypanosoma rangeli]